MIFLFYFIILEERESQSYYKIKFMSGSICTRKSTQQRSFLLHTMCERHTGTRTQKKTLVNVWSEKRRVCVRMVIFLFVHSFVFAFSV